MSFVSDTFVIFRRQLRIALRNPAWVVIGLLQPILYLALFGPLLAPIAGQLGTTNAYTLLVQGIILIALSFAFGLTGSIGGMLLGLLLALLVGAAASSSSYAFALTTKSEDALAPILNAVTLPVLLLSGILLPMTLGPRWLQTISDILPTKYVVDGVRAAFRGDLLTAETLWGVVWAVVLCAAGLFVGTRTFRRENA